MASYIYVDSNYLWSANSDPDFLMIQVPPLAVMHDDPARASADGWHQVLPELGFAPLLEADGWPQETASGARLALNADGSADLKVTLGGQTDAFHLGSPQPAWCARVQRAGQVPVLFTQTAVGDDGVADGARLRADFASGAVWGAQVPVGD